MSMTRQMATQFNGMRGRLYADRNVWVDEIDSLLERLSPRALDEDWIVNDGLYETGTPYQSTCDSSYSGPSRRYNSGDPETLVQFAYVPSHIGHSLWIPQVRHFWVAYETGWEEEYNVDGNAYGQRVFGVDGFKKSKRNQSPKYIVGGRLADPLVTDSLPRVVEHVEEQFDAVADRVLFNLDLERIHAEHSRGSTQEDEHHSPISVGGIGKKSAKRMAKYYGAYSNILQYDSVQGASRAYGNTPNVEGAYENVETAVEAYREAHAAGDTQSSLLPEDLVEYPATAPKWWTTYTHPHTSQKDDDENEGAENVPDGCFRGTHDQSQNLGTIRSVVIEACGDGYWRLSPSAEAPESAYEMLIPFGTEKSAETYARGEYVNARSETYVHDCWVATQILNTVCSPLAYWDGGLQEQASSLDPTEFKIPDSELELWVVRMVSESVIKYLSGKIGWSSTVWSENEDSYRFREIDKEIAYLMASMSVDMISGWRVRKAYNYQTNAVEFRFVPEDVDMTTWIQALNRVTVEYTDDYEERSDCDEGQAGDAKYVVDDTRGNSFVTASVGRVVARLKDRFARVENTVKEVARVERCYDENEDETGQVDILPELDGIGTTTARNLAGIHGTYARLLDADNLGVSLSYHFDGDFDTLKNHLRPAVTSAIEK